MAYATLQNLIRRFTEARLVQLTDRFDPPAGVIDPTIVDEALEHARQLIDGYLADCYRLPLDPVPGLLEGLACDIAFFRLFLDPTDEARKRYEEALKVLKDIQAGRIRLPVEGGAQAPAAPGQISVTSSPRLFGRERTRGF